LSRLGKTLLELGQDRPARPLVCPEEYLTAWRRYAEGANAELAPRALRYLSWEPDVVLDLRFHEYLNQAGLELGARSLQGFVRAGHLRWPGFVSDRAIHGLAMHRLRAYQGSNRILQRWQAGIERVLDSNAPDALALWMLQGRRTPQDTVTEWGID